MLIYIKLILVHTTLAHIGCYYHISGYCLISVYQRGIENGTPGRKSARLSRLADSDETAAVRPSTFTQAEEAAEETQSTVAETLLVYKQIKDYMSKR